MTERHDGKETMRSGLDTAAERGRTSIDVKAAKALLATEPVGEVARRFGVSSTTLYRRLRAAGLTKQQRRWSVEADELEFLHFLTTSYRGRKTDAPMSQKVARDVLSRCRRIEHILKIPLTKATVGTDRALERLYEAIRKRRADFGCETTRPDGYFYAARLYGKFLSVQAPKATAANQSA